MNNNDRTTTMKERGKKRLEAYRQRKQQQRERKKTQSLAHSSAPIAPAAAPVLSNVVEEEEKRKERATEEKRQISNEDEDDFTPVLKERTGRRSVEEEDAMMMNATTPEEEEEVYIVDERDVLKSMLHTMKRERDAETAKRMVTEARARDLEEELRDGEMTTMQLRDELRRKEEEEKQASSNDANANAATQKSVGLKGVDGGEKNDANEEILNKIAEQLDRERAKNEILTEALNDAKEETAKFKRISENTKSKADSAEVEADELEKTIVLGEERARTLGKLLREERVKAKNLRETVNIIMRIVVRMTTTTKTTDSSQQQQKINKEIPLIIEESAFRRSKKTKSRLLGKVEDEEEEEATAEENDDDYFEGEAFFETTVERIKNALDIKVESLKNTSKKHEKKVKELGLVLAEAEDEIESKTAIIEQLQTQRDALLAEIESRDEHLDSVEKDLESLLQSELRLREEVSLENVKNVKLMDIIEKQALYSGKKGTPKNDGDGDDKENATLSPTTTAEDPSDEKNKRRTKEEQNLDYYSKYEAPGRTYEGEIFERKENAKNSASSFDAETRYEIKAKSAPATPATMNKSYSRLDRGANNKNIDPMDVYTPLLHVIAHRLAQLREDRAKVIHGNNTSTAST